MEKVYQFGTVKVTVIDKSNHEERKKALKNPLIEFYKATRKDVRK